MCDINSPSGRLMLRALIEGKTAPQEMADLAKGLLRKKIPALELALEGKLEEHLRFLLGLQLRRLEVAEKDLATPEQRIQQRTAAALRAWLAIRGTVASPELFVTARGTPFSRWGVAYVLRRHTETADRICLTLRGKQVSPHVLRHTLRNDRATSNKRHSKSFSMVGA
jgi:integrase